MKGYRGKTFGRLCISTCAQGAGAPLVDGASTRVDDWGPGTHGSIVIRRPGAADRPSRAVVVVVRGWRGPHFWLWRSRWRRVRHPLRTFRSRNAPRGAVMIGDAVEQCVSSGNYRSSATK